LDEGSQAIMLTLLTRRADCSYIAHPAEPRQHRAVDLWALLLIWQHGASAPQHARAAEALLRRKVLEGQAGARWLEGAVWDHQVRAFGWAQQGLKGKGASSLSPL
jgi:hypothetical protein